MFKKLTTNLKPSYIFKRPNGARDCGLFNTGGLVDDQSGFPSGGRGGGSSYPVEGRNFF